MSALGERDLLPYDVDSVQACPRRSRTFDSACESLIRFHDRFRALRTAALRSTQCQQRVELRSRTLPKPVMPQLVPNRDFAHNWMRRNWSFHFAAVLELQGKLKAESFPMRDQVNQLGRTAVRTVVGVACAAVLSCGDGDASTRGPTQIVGQPQNQTVAAGATATFSIQLAGEPPLSINWTKGGVRIPGATATRYTTPPTVPSDDGLTFGVALAARDASGVPVNIDSKMASLTVVPAVPASPVSLRPPAVWSWHARGTLPRCCRIGKVLIVGGGSPANSPSAAVATSAELYDPATNGFTETGSTTGARRGGHSATLLRDGRVLVCGGSDLTSIDGRSDAEIYDPRRVVSARQARWGRDGPATPPSC